MWLKRTAIHTQYRDGGDNSRSFGKRDTYFRDSWKPLFSYSPVMPRLDLELNQRVLADRLSQKSWRQNWKGQWQPTEMSFTYYGQKEWQKFMASASLSHRHTNHQPMALPVTQAWHGRFWRFQEANTQTNSWRKSVELVKKLQTPQSLCYNIPGWSSPFRISHEWIAVTQEWECENDLNSVSSRHYSLNWHQYRHKQFWN